MKLYGAIDLHSDNNVTVVIDEQDRVVYQKRLPNDLTLILKEFSGYGTELQGIVVESTYNWYWVVDGLMKQGYRVHLANTAAIQQYEGLKYTDDHSDARWLAHLLRLGVLPEGYIYPRSDRPVRDLLRKRSQVVRQRTTSLLSIQNLMTRNTGSSLSANQIKGLDVQQVDELLANRDLALAVKANLSVMCSADEPASSPCLLYPLPPTATPLLHPHYQASQLVWVAPTSASLRSLPRFLHLSESAFFNADRRISLVTV